MGLASTVIKKVKDAVGITNVEQQLNRRKKPLGVGNFSDMSKPQKSDIIVKDK